MTKFNAQKLGDLLTTDATIARASRASQYAAQGLPFLAVVMIEVDDGSWCELDAESYQHAKIIADCWVRSMGARGASCRKLRGPLSGRIELQSFYTVFSTPDGTWDGPDGPVA